MRLLTPLLFSAGTLSALDIQIDYTYDGNNFFDTQDKKDAIEAVAKFYGNLIQDNLLRIDSSEFSSSSKWVPQFFHPVTGNSTTIAEIVVPEDTIIIYVGSRNLPGSTRGVGGPNGFATGTSGTSSWIDRLLGRGQEGAEFRSSEAHLRTDIGIWGGAISFDDDSTWNFSLDSNQSGVEFLKIALHEMGHVLGLGPSDPWDNLIDSGTFTGPAATASNGTAPTADGSHFQSTLSSPLFGSFGVTHGTSRPALMLPSSTDTGSNFDVITDLDLAALIDIGWEIAIPTDFDTNSLSPSGASFSWPSNSFCSYELRRTTDLESFSGGSSLITGDGSVQSWSDPSPDSSAAFYQFTVSSNTSLSKSQPTAQSKKSAARSETFESIEMAPRVATGCYCDDPEGH
ncbi:MAG: matrixin family metalloprotease [Roseibacillus sp.]